jgi:hypothetical protein
MIERIHKAWKLGKVQRNKKGNKKKGLRKKMRKNLTRRLNMQQEKA